MVQEGYCQQLIQALGRPIASMFATFDGAILPAHFGNINSDVVTAVDLVAGLDVSSRLPRQAPVMVRLTEEDEFEFLRE